MPAGDVCVAAAGDADAVAGVCARCGSAGGRREGRSGAGVKLGRGEEWRQRRRSYPGHMTEMLDE
jgi:hypothetical protein